MKKQQFILSLLFLLAVTICAQLTGDLNGDEKLDVADWVRIEAMVSNVLTPVEAADLDQDGTVTSNDADMLLGLIRGTFAMPLALEYETSTESKPGGEGEEPQIMTCYTGAGFKITWEQAGSDDNSSLWTVDTLPESPLSEDISWKTARTIGVSNMPYREEPTLAFDVPQEAAGTPALLVGILSNAKGSKESLWSYQIVRVNDGGGLVFQDGKLLWTPSQSYDNRNPATLSCTVIYPAQANNTRSAGQTRGTSDWEDLGIDFELHSAEGGLCWYTTTHFDISTYGDFAVTDMQRLAQNLEKAYGVIGGLGFRQDFPSLWGKIGVVVRKTEGEPEDSCCVEPGRFFGPKLEFHEGVLTSDRIGSIVIHELMHYHHYVYATNYKSLWLEEMCAAWSECLMSDDPENYRPAIYDDPRGVLDGLPMASEKPSLYSDGTTNTTASAHGYNLYPFAVWLAEKYPPKELWHEIFESRGYAIDQPVTALIQGLGGLDSEAQIGDLYDDFLREYLGLPGTIPYPSDDMTPFSCFNSSDTGRFAKNGKKTLVKKVGDLFLKENIEHEFAMPQLGAATWLFTFEKGTDEFMRDYSEVLVKTNSTQYDYFVLLFENGKFSITSVDEIERDEEKNLSVIKIPLDAIGKSDGRTAFGIVAINHNYDEYDASATNNLTISLNFSGPLVVTDIVAKMPYSVTSENYHWEHDYTIVKSDLTFTPLGKTTFANGNVDFMKLTWNGVETTIPIVTAELGTDTVPETLELNITGTMADEPVPMFLDNSSSLYLWWTSFNDCYRVAECTGHYVVMVSKTVDGASQIVSFSTGDIGEYNPIYGGMTYTAEDFAPSEQTGLSRFHLTIPEIDPNATSYSVSITTHYLTYRQELDSEQKVNEGSWNNSTMEFVIVLEK